MPLNLDNAARLQPRALVFQIGSEDYPKAFRRLGLGLSFGLRTVACGILPKLDFVVVIFGASTRGFKVDRADRPKLHSSGWLSAVLEDQHTRAARADPHAEARHVIIPFDVVGFARREGKFFHVLGRQFHGLLLLWEEPGKKLGWIRFPSVSS